MMTRRQRPPTTVLASALLLLACDPEAKNLGVDLPAGETEWTVDWRVDGAIDSPFFDLATMPDGGVVVLESHSPEGHLSIRRYGADGSESSVFTEPYTAGVPGGHLAVTGDAVFHARDRNASGTAGLRASVRRISYDAEIGAEYVHPRSGDENSFATGVASSDTEVALIIGNWGKLEEGEPWFEVQRLDHDLQAVADAIPFDEEVVQVAYDASGTLLILEAPEEGAALLHRPVSEMQPLEVDCGSLLVSGGAPLCASIHPPFQITNYETGDVLALDELDLDAYAPSTRMSSTVFSSSSGPEAPLRVVEILEGGAIGRSTQIPLDAAALGVVPLGVRQTFEGAVYAFAYEAFVGEMCPQADQTCLRSYLVRLAAPE